MDADKRHHLKQNELAEALAKLRHFSSHRELQYWLAGILVILLAFLAYRGFSAWQAGRAAAGWQQLSEINLRVENNAPGALDELRGLTNSSNPTLAAAARLRLAAAVRTKAVETGTLDTAALRESVDLLKPLLNQTSLAPTLVGAAGLSLATAYESLRQFDDAENLYKMLVDDPRFAGTGYPIVATERLDGLRQLRSPVDFTVGLPPQEPPAVVPSPGPMVGPPGPPVLPQGALDALNTEPQPAPARKPSAAESDTDDPAPATEPGRQGDAPTESGSQGQ